MLDVNLYTGGLETDTQLIISDATGH